MQVLGELGSDSSICGGVVGLTRLWPHGQTEDAQSTVSKATSASEPEYDDKTIRMIRNDQQYRKVSGLCLK
jgi:hypothetical protein